MSRIAIWKYPIDQPWIVTALPSGARILTVAWQNGNPTIWAEVDPDAERKAIRSFAAVPTGSPWSKPEGATYLGSAVSDELVFHVYEVPVE